MTDVTYIYLYFCTSKASRTARLTASVHLQVGVSDDARDVKKTETKRKHTEHFCTSKASKLIAWHLAAGFSGDRSDVSGSCCVPVTSCEALRDTPLGSFLTNKARAVSYLLY